MFGDENYYTRMVEAGARGFLLKDSSFEEVLRAVETVQGGGSYFSEGLLASLAHRMRTREGAWRRTSCRGANARSSWPCAAVLSNQEIADELFISKRTVDKHRANILEKTGCKNTASLVVLRHTPRDRGDLTGRPRGELGRRSARRRSDFFFAACGRGRISGRSVSAGFVSAGCAAALRAAAGPPCGRRVMAHE